jgi:predicted PurR-regulated permease PerM
MSPPWRSEYVGTALTWLALALLLYLVFLIAKPFLSPLGWAAVIAVIFYPAYARLERRWGATRAAVLSTAAVTVIVVAPLLFLMTAFIREAVDAVGGLQRAFAEGRLAWIERVWSSLIRRVPIAQRVDLAALATDTATRGAMFLAAQSGSIVRNLAGFVFDVVLTLFATFFLLRDSSSIMVAVRGLLPIDETDRERLITQTRDLIHGSVTSAVIVASVQGTLGGLVFAAVGIDAAVFWGVVMAFLCLLPLGAWVVWLPAALMLGASGAIGRAIVLAALGIGIISAVDNVLRPWLLSGRTPLNGLLIFVSLLGGMAVFGPLGLVLGPIVVATAMALVTAYVDSTSAPGRVP